jgi:hypothetical protein
MSPAIITTTNQSSQPAKSLSPPNSFSGRSTSIYGLVSMKKRGTGNVKCGSSWVPSFGIPAGLRTLSGVSNVMLDPFFFLSTLSCESIVRECSKPALWPYLNHRTKLKWQILFWIKPLTHYNMPLAILRSAFDTAFSPTVTITMDLWFHARLGPEMAIRACGASLDNGRVPVSFRNQR